ncbi:polysaccharide biosynthesis/export family protein [Campylobacter gastrosuis]|uniref:Polysaccharide export protein n=1 Tax=Campylobacter gastrosuis TaxID=2974576 RepID=A0ABT7HSP3_9BACT|nr:polysaccharide biosynthesis/export family protein [Campylobacter gastrosuis]MDL0089941.1 polysaccharide export protein [Campylobacter gastrosuis]
MKKFLIIMLLSLFANAFEPPIITNNENNQTYAPEYKIFGKNLFNGSFSLNNTLRYNPDYILNIKDVISLKIWGAIDMELKLTIDEQGNIFIPKVGAIKLLGVLNKNITKVISNELKKIYKDNVYIYANLDNFQPVSVFVTGAVIKPGLYDGLSSDSVLQFIDKAKGILDQGSYRNISVIRNKKVIAKIDLYDYLISGELDNIQLQTGDAIKIDYLKDYVTLDGDVKEPLQVEVNNAISLKALKQIAQPDTKATDIIVSYFDDNNYKIHTIRSIKDDNFMILPGQNVKFVSNTNTKTIQINIAGEHNGLSNVVVARGTTLDTLIKDLSYTPSSLKDQIHLYRKSIAELQKQLLDSSLKELEASVLKTGSSTEEEANIRMQESNLVLDFIKRAKEVMPKGRVVLDASSDFSQILLEDGDTIFIPQKSHIITVQGDVKIPSALSYVKDKKLEYYLELCGGLSTRADEDNILIIKQGGSVITAKSKRQSIEPGDSILVLSKLDSKNLPIAKSITQILYQIAVSTGVLLRI